ncbi:restriction endonuclease subunit S [Bacteroides cellulosilyticus]|uniref:restriction endonuclease subunit S n=2 Tax=Bacteroides TaxID=816 RepID=UPI003564858D
MADNNENKVLNVPHLRFPEFSGEWDSFKLVELGKFIGGGTPSSSNLSFWTGSIPWISSSDIKEDNINNISISRYITEDAIEKSATKYCPAPVILIVSRVGVGKVALSHTSLCTSQDFCNIIDIKCHPVFLSYNLLRTMKRKSREVQGTSIKGITSDELQKIRVFIPKNKDEQNKISNLLTLLDERIATQTKIIKKYESLIKGISNLLLYETEGKSVCLGDILIERSERTQTNNQYDVLSSTVKGIFSQREYFSKDIASENNVGYKIIRLHDIVLSPQNLWMGNINYNDKFDIGIVSPSYKIFSIGEGYDKRFVAAMLKTHRALYNYILVSEQGASIVRRNLNMEAFSQLVFKLPTFDKQRKIGYAISSLKSQLEAANKIVRAYISQKQYLLRQMFI